MKFSEEIIKVFDALAEKLGVIIDWTSENIIPYIMDLFERWQRYEIIKKSFWIILFFTIFILCIFFLRILIKNKTINNKTHYSIFYDTEYIYDGVAHCCKPYSNRAYEEKIIFSESGVAVIVISIITLISCIVIAIFSLISLIKLIMIPELVFYNTFM